MKSKNMSKCSSNVTTRSVSKKAKWSRGINTKDFKTFPLLMGALFENFSNQMKKQVPSWDDSIDDYID